MSENDTYFHQDATQKIIGAAIEVHKILGPGFLEAIYEEALAKEFQLRGIKFERQKCIEIAYKGEIVGTHRLDLMVEENVVVELKAVKDFSDLHQAQLLSYLKVTGSKVGLLLNFNKPVLDIKRMVL